MKPFWHFSEDEMRAEVDRNLWPTMMCCHAAVSPFRERGGGVIVNIGSNAATEGGFLGFGGERLSDNERKLLGEIKTALGVA